MTSDLDTFRQGATWYRNGRDWPKEQRDNAIRRANERATTVNVSFSTVCETSTDEESFAQQSHLSFNDTLITETSDESLRSTAVHLEQSKRSRGKRSVSHGVDDSTVHTL
jgi:hypothetical protein